MSLVRIGILGCANIARQFVRDVAASTKVRVVAAASRQQATASAFCQDLGVARAHASYEALLADPDVDAVYLPLPNSLHAEWAIKAATLGKHVLCEKPLALGVHEASAMFAAARAHGVLLLEAYPYQFQPATDAMRVVLERGDIGVVRSVQACFGFALRNRVGNIRLDPQLGGGSLLDAGSYATSVIRLAMGSAPASVMCDATWDPSGVDISASATLYYADGRRAQLACAMDSANHRRATIVGSSGTLETEYLNHTAAHGAASEFGYLPSQLRIRRGTANTVAFEDIVSPTGSGFRFAADTFADMVLASDVPAMERYARASLDNAATLDALARSARQGERVTVAL